MEYVKLGNSDLNVSRICMGCMGFGESYNFDGKTMIPFCTSGGSGIWRSGKNLEENAGTGIWLEGKRFGSNVSEADLKSWIEGIR